VAGENDVARKGKSRAGRTARVPISDEELIGRLKEDTPEALSGTLSESRFNFAVEGLLKESRYRLSFRISIVGSVVSII
jgi:hypothetical protein